MAGLGIRFGVVGPHANQLVITGERLGGILAGFKGAGEHEDDFGPGLEAVGLSYGPTFQRIRSARITGSMCIAQLASPESHDGEPTWPYTVHPALSDAALQCVAVLLAMYAACALAQPFPGRPVKIVVPFVAVEMPTIFRRFAAVESAPPGAAHIVSLPVVESVG